MYKVGHVKTGKIVKIFALMKKYVQVYLKEYLIQFQPEYFSSRFLSKNIKFKIYSPLILFIVYIGVKFGVSH